MSLNPAMEIDDQELHLKGKKGIRSGALITRLDC